MFDKSHLLLEISKQIHLKIKQRHLEVLQEVIFIISLHHAVTLKPQVYTNLRWMDIWTEDTFHFIRLRTSCVTKQILQTRFFF